MECLCRSVSGGFRFGDTRASHFELRLGHVEGDLGGARVASREELTAYKLSALCGGGRLLLPEIVAICEDCAEKISENLSQKTRDRLDDFRRDVLDLFPDGLMIEPIVI